MSVHLHRAEDEHPAHTLVHTGLLRQRGDLLLGDGGVGHRPLQVFDLQDGVKDPAVKLGLSIS